VYFNQLIRASPRTTVGLVVFAIVLALTVLAPIVAPQDPTAMQVFSAFKPPSMSHLFGTDNFGRDMLSRTLYGGRPALSIGTATVLLSLLIGGSLGVAAGYVRGLVDLVVMRIAELAFTLPVLVLAIAIIAYVGAGAQNVVIALTVIFTPLFARVARASTLEISQRPFILAARAVGDSPLAIMIRQIVPNIAGPLLVQAALAFAYALLAEASLSFLGLGTQPPLPSWGRMLTDAMPFAQVSPWPGFFPGMMILITVVSLNLIADGLRDLLDPTLRKASGLRDVTAQ
jgi:peptide/nickel transport system permease protein